MNYKLWMVKAIKYKYLKRFPVLIDAPSLLSYFSLADDWHAMSIPSPNPEPINFLSIKIPQWWANCELKKLGMKHEMIHHIYLAQVF